MAALQPHTLTLTHLSFLLAVAGRLLSVLLHPPVCTAVDHDTAQRWDGRYDFPI